MLFYLKDFIAAYLCTVGFSIMFNVPRKIVGYCGLSGAIGWVLYIWISVDMNSTIAACFVGALFVGLFGEYLAYKLKKPATIFVIPGIIPLVPGYGIYYSMFQIIDKNYTEALDVGFESMLSAISIAAGVIIATSVGRVVRQILRIRFKGKA